MMRREFGEGFFEQFEVGAALVFGGFTEFL
jgi:hypothetical protein